MRAAIPLILTASLALVACDRSAPEVAPVPEAPVEDTLELPTSPSETSTPEEDLAAVDAPDHDLTIIDADEDAPPAVTYDCDDGKSIQAFYQTEENGGGVTLLIEGEQYALYAVVSASGARYASEQGFNAEEGIQWLTQDNEAVMLNMILDDTATPDDNTVLFRCEVQESDA